MTEVADFPDEAMPLAFRIADARSVEAQRRLKDLNRLELSAGVAGAAFGTLAVLETALQQPATAAAGLAFLIAVGARLAARQLGLERDWFDGRAVAETVKSAAWRYMTRTPAFDDDTTADAELVDRIREAIAIRPSLMRPGERPAASAQITDAMRAARARPLPESLGAYRWMRLRQQADWYDRRGRQHERARTLWSWVGGLAQGLAIALAVVGFWLQSLADLNLLGIAAAVAASATAWSQLNRHDDQSRAYALASQELLLIDSLVPSVRDLDAFAALVANGEAAISREHTLWVAKRSDRLPGRPADDPRPVAGRTSVAGPAATGAAPADPPGVEPTER